MPGPDFDKAPPITTMPDSEDWFAKAVAERKAGGGWGWRNPYQFPSVPAQAVPEPVPTFEERRQRCEDMGLILCSCTGVAGDGVYRMIYNINCPIHGRRQGWKP